MGKFVRDTLFSLIPLLLVVECLGGVAFSRISVLIRISVGKFMLVPYLSFLFRAMMFKLCVSSIIHVVDNLSRYYINNLFKTLTKLVFSVEYIYMILMLSLRDIPTKKQEKLN